MIRGNGMSYVKCAGHKIGRTSTEYMAVGGGAKAAQRIYRMHDSIGCLQKAHSNRKRY